jgi:hypothetical protein
MTSPPERASQPDEDANPALRRESTDRGLTIGLHVALLLLMGVLAIIPGMSLHDWLCINHPGECNETLRAFANFMGRPALLIIFGVSILVSVILIVRNRRAFYVPIIGAVAMIGCFAVWFTLVRNGFLIPYP